MPGQLKIQPKPLSRVWDLFAVTHLNAQEIMEIERDDDAGHFSDDDDAVEFVVQQALKGNKLSAKALFLHNNPSHLKVAVPKCLA